MKMLLNDLRWRFVAPPCLVALIIIIFLQLTAITGHTAPQEDKILSTHDLKNIFTKIVSDDNSFNAIFPGQNSKLLISAVSLRRSNFPPAVFLTRLFPKKGPTS